MGLNEAAVAESLVSSATYTRGELCSVMWQIKRQGVNKSHIIEMTLISCEVMEREHELTLQRASVHCIYISIKVLFDFNSS